LGYKCDREQEESFCKLRAYGAQQGEWDDVK
jgi:hypothetical protein